MAQITIRNLDDSIMQALKRRAAAAGRSTEEEARRCLAVATGIDRESALQRLETLREGLKNQASEPLAEATVHQMREERAHRFADPSN